MVDMNAVYTNVFSLWIVGILCGVACVWGETFRRVRNYGLKTCVRDVIMAFALTPMTIIFWPLMVVGYAARTVQGGEVPFNELPPEVRAALEKQMAEGTVFRVDSEAPPADRVKRVE